jgi:hypothetical protein
MMNQAQQAMQAVEERAAQIAEASAALEQDKLDQKTAASQNQVRQKEIEVAVERLRRVKAEFDTHVIKELSGLDQKAAEIGGGEDQPDEAVVKVALAVRSIDDTLSTFMKAVDAALGKMPGQGVESAPGGEGADAVAEQSVSSSAPEPPTNRPT